MVGPQYNTISNSKYHTSDPSWTTPQHHRCDRFTANYWDSAKPRQLCYCHDNHGLPVQHYDGWYDSPGLNY